MPDTVAETRLRVLVLSPSGPGAAVLVRCVQALGHAAEACADVAAAEGLWRSAAREALVLDLDALAGGALDALSALAAVMPTGKRCMLLGATSAPDPLHALALAAAGLDRIVAPAGTAAEWRRALDPALPPGVDPQVLAGLRELDVEVSRASAQALLDDTPGKLEALRDGLARRDFGAARRTAHSLKGSASQLGALRVAGLCARIEDQLARDEHAAAADTCARVASAWDAAEAWFRAEAER